MFLYKLLMESLREINNGIPVNLPNNDHIIIRGILLMGTCDLPAKCECVNFMQFNGDYGCQLCLTKGKNAVMGPKSNVHIYPFQNEFILRTSEQSIEFANGVKTDKSFNRVKGHTILSKIMPDFINGMVIDRMHCVDGGVSKKLVTLLFDKKYSQAPFSLCSVINVIDD